MNEKINRISLSLFWLVLTVSLAIWWFTLGLRQAQTISDLSLALGEPYNTLSSNLMLKQTRMIWMEGTFFIILLSMGGAVLVWFSYLDLKRNQLIQDFFSTVTHEMKTPLAGLRLQVEGLMEDLSDNKEYSNLLNRALKESDRIESQMDKAFYLASLMRSEALFIEKVDLNNIKQFILNTFPSVEWIQEKTYIIQADRKAMESILQNLIENSYKHGFASKVRIEINNEKKCDYNTDFKNLFLSKIVKFISIYYHHKPSLRIQVIDNGRGFQGFVSQIGKPFLRISSSSGTGIGLYIVTQLIQKMKGKIYFLSNATGFSAKIILPLFVEKK
jgi:signal transduction histidine kinase